MHQKDTSGGSHTTPTALTNKHVGRKLSSFDSLKRKASSSTAPRSTTTYPLAKPPHRPVTHGGTTRKSTITRGSGSTKESSGLGVSDQPHRSQSDSEDESEYSGEEENRERMKDDTTSVVTACHPYISSSEDQPATDEADRSCEENGTC